MTGRQGLYDDAAGTEWFRGEYQRIGAEITALKALPERQPGMRLVPAGRTVGQEWEKADDARRREMLSEFEVRVDCCIRSAMSRAWHSPEWRLPCLFRTLSS